MNIGEKITDGTVQWVLRHKGEMHNVGDIWMTKAAFNSAGFLIHAITGLVMLDVHICDGTNGTVNMVNRFPMGTNDGAQFGVLGGANAKVITTAQMPVHAHGASAWTDAQGLHAHNILGQTVQNRNDKCGYIQAGITGMADEDLYSKKRGYAYTDVNGVQLIDSQGNHGHNIGISIANAGGNAAFDVRPAYTAVAFVQKIY